MRTFIAYDIPKMIRNEIYERSPKFRGIKYVEPENMHLTVKFLGEVDDKIVNDYKERLNKLKLKKLNARLGNVGFFPSEEFIRVVWVGVNADFDKNVLKALDVKDWIPHITIGRVKRKLEEDEIRKFKELKFDDEFTIKTLTIYRSELTSEGPIYSILKRYNLCD